MATTDYWPAYTSDDTGLREEDDLLLRQSPLGLSFTACLPYEDHIRHALTEFWALTGLYARLWALSDQVPYFAQVQPWFHPTGSSVALAYPAIEQLLTTRFGSRPQLSSTGWTALETDILYACCQHLSQALGLSERPSPDKTWYTQWALELEGYYIGSLSIWWPRRMILAQAAPPAEPEPSAGRWFDGLSATVTVSAGRALIALDDVYQLMPGDLVVLDDSTAGRLMIDSPEVDSPLRFYAAMSNVPHIPDTPHEDDETSEVGGAGWDHLMVEVSAEFEPFLLPLREVKLMSEGLLVEIDDLLHNRIRLHSQGTSIAEGSLVVVGDKFAVRVEQVVGQTVEETARSMTGPAAPVIPDITTSPPGMGPVAANTWPDDNTFLSQPTPDEDMDAW